MAGLVRGDDAVAQRVERGVLHAAFLVRPDVIPRLLDPQVERLGADEVRHQALDLGAVEDHRVGLVALHRADVGRGARGQEVRGDVVGPGLNAQRARDDLHDLIPRQLLV